MLIGNKVRKLRELRNYTQEHMAKELNMTTTGYGKIERDESEVTVQKLEKIATILGIKVEDIINFNESLVFNVMHNQTGIMNGYVVHNESFENERKLFEQIIAQLKEENAYLKNIISKFQEK